MFHYFFVRVLLFFLWRLVVVGSSIDWQYRIHVHKRPFKSIHNIKAASWNRTFSLSFFHSALFLPSSFLRLIRIKFFFFCCSSVIECFDAVIFLAFRNFVPSQPPCGNVIQFVCVCKYITNNQHRKFLRKTHSLFPPHTVSHLRSNFFWLQLIMYFVFFYFAGELNQSFVHCFSLMDSE